MEFVNFILQRDRMSGIVAPGVARDDIRRRRQPIHDTAFPFVSPLGADQYGNWHMSPLILACLATISA